MIGFTTLAVLCAHDHATNLLVPASPVVAAASGGFLLFNLLPT